MSIENTGGANGVAWDLKDLYSNILDPKLDKDIADAQRLAQEFEAKYRGKISALKPTDAAFLLQAIQQVESLYEIMDRPAIYASLVHAAKTDDAAHGALVAKTRETRTKINQHLLFFDLELIAIPDDIAKGLAKTPQLLKYAHFLEQKRAWKPHYLSEPEEKVMDVKTLTGRSAFVRLFDETVASMTYPFIQDGVEQKLSFQQINAKLYDADRNIRKAGAEGITKGLKEQSKLLSYLFNTLVLDHQNDCEVRKFPSPMASRHLANETSAEMVQALMDSVEKHGATVHRYYKLKKRLLGLPSLEDYDRYAPIQGDMPLVSWQDASKLVRESYHALSPEAGKIIDQFFDANWIDAELRHGKRGGAFSSSAIPSVHPYILMSYTGKMRDVSTLAHELGHGLHQYLSRKNGYLQCDTPLTTAETASVFGEMLVFKKLLEKYQDPKVRLALLCGKLEDSFATVFRQVVLTRFEQKMHKARKEEGELSSERFNKLWTEANQPMFGDSVNLSENYGYWWSYIGHFVHVPFYCYAYSFGELLVLALVQKYEQEKELFVPKYMDLLSRGGSESPVDLLARMNIDLNDPGFWELGLKLLDRMVVEVEELATQLGK
ncbi:MAG: M3 family oligoendopeptidase [Planctomycetes bacterium]|nr:M3 family oligoendopeptidase [Planctomycetota bacterium]